ncbi:hypothetical protein KSS87_006710 [Heliosperma pusillum]|nr:hypothetical protein KSS87_006710 [Heliosperma pusillum]
MGLDKSLYGPLRNHQLALDPLPSLSRVYHAVLQEERLLVGPTVTPEVTEVMAFAVRNNPATAGSASSALDWRALRDAERLERNKIRCSYCNATRHDVNNCYIKSQKFPDWWGDRPRTLEEMKAKRGSSSRPQGGRPAGPDAAGTAAGTAGGPDAAGTVAAGPSSALTTTDMGRGKRPKFPSSRLKDFVVGTTADTSSDSDSSPDSPRSSGTLMSTMKFEAIYQFGDSLSDTGNLVRESNRGGVNYARLPYGQTFFHRATGRCSDGLLMVDFFALHFHLPLLNPILENGSDFTYGANFAVAGATALDTTTLASINISSTVTYSSLSTQIGWFKSLISSFCPNSTDCERSLQKSLVLMGEIGGNDYNFAFSQRKTMEQVYALIPQVVQTLKDTVIELIGLGVTNIVVPGNFPIGCVPLYLFQFETNDTSKYDELHCLKEYNEFSQFHNQRLIEAIKELQDQYPNVAIAYADYYSALRWVISHSFALGFEDGPEKACCSEGDNPYNYDPSRSCGSPGVPVCPNPAKRVSWDGIHMTQEGNRHLARWLLGQFLPELARQRKTNSFHA